MDQSSPPSASTLPQSQQCQQTIDKPPPPGKILRRHSWSGSRKINVLEEDDISLAEGTSSAKKASEANFASSLIAGVGSGSLASVVCAPLDLVRTRLTTELPGQEHYKGITDAFAKIVKEEGIRGLYAGISPTLFVAIPNFAISYTVYGTLKEYVLDDDLFYAKYIRCTGI